MEFQKVLETRRSVRKYDPNVSVTREQMEHWGIEEEVLFQDAWANMFAKRPPLLMDLSLIHI